MKSARLWLAEKVFNAFLKPFEKVMIAQKVLAQHGKDPAVQKEFERAFGVNRQSRTVKQWNNLVRVYGLETVAKIENMSEDQVQLKCRKFSEQIKQEFKKRHAQIQ